MHDRILYRLTWLAATLSLGHHLDHLIRGNAVGWPLSEEVNAFTVTCVYETRRWAQQRRTRHATRLVGMGWGGGPGRDPGAAVARAVCGGAAAAARGCELAHSIAAEPDLSVDRGAAMFAAGVSSDGREGARDG
jgi:hypothetical protein